MGGERIRRDAGRWKVLGVMALMVMVGCSSDPIGPSAPAVYGSLLAEGQGDVRARQGDLALRLAVVLGDQSMRDRLKTDMRDSPYREYKLDFRAYLASTRGQRLRSSVAALRGQPPQDLDQELATLPPLEFYMPVTEHRRKWQGDGDLIVATLLEDSDMPIAWDTKGNRVILNPSTPPETPVLVLVPVETNFSRPLPLDQLALRGNPNRSTIEDPSPSAGNGPSQIIDDGGGGGGAGTSPAGLYITFQRLTNLGEPWTLGAPEIEVHIHGPETSASPQYGADLACSGDRVGFPRGFNQDGGFWNGEALLFTDQQIAAYNAIQQQGFNVSVWEDDNTLCSIKKEDFNLADRFRGIAVAVGGWTGVAAATGLNAWVVGAGFVAGVYSSLTFLWTNDDFLGTYVEASKVGASYSDANFVLYENGTAQNGRGKLEMLPAH